MSTTKTTWFDKLPPAVRHALLLTAGALLTWVGTLIPTLPSPLPEVGLPLLGMVVLYVTKLTKQYGIGKGSK